MVAYACKPSTWEIKEEDHHELETILGYIGRFIQISLRYGVRHCFK